MPSEQLFNPGTALVFKSTGGDATLTFASTANGALAHSAQLDRGTGAKPGLYRWFLRVEASGAQTIGNQVRIYLVQAKDATDVPGRIPTTDGEISGAADRTRNLGAPIGVGTSDSTTSTDEIITSGMAFVYARFITVALFNDLGVTFNASETGQYFEIVPIPPQQQ
jgi:hypothetical protein